MKIVTILKQIHKIVMNKIKSIMSICSVWNSFYLVAQGYMFLSKGQWTYGPTLCQSIDTHIRSKYVWV